MHGKSDNSNIGGNRKDGLSVQKWMRMCVCNLGRCGYRCVARNQIHHLIDSFHPTYSLGSNYGSFDLFDYKFDHSSYFKFCAKYYIFIVACFILIKVLQEWLKFEYAQFFWIILVVKLEIKKSNYNLERME